MKKYAIIQDNKIFVFDDRWITINADEDRKGQHVLIKENGDIVAGLGGKFRNLRDLGKKKSGVVVDEDELVRFLNTRAGEKFIGIADKNFHPLSSIGKTITKSEIINFNPVKYHEKQPTDEEIISRLGGPDKTKGSCASLAIAYTAQKGGMDVLDFRGEPTRSFFSDDYNRDRIFKDAIVARDTETVKGTIDALKVVESAPVNKEFILATGNHAAVVRKNTAGEFEYLELQGYWLGWKPMGTLGSDQMKGTLRRRFKTKIFFRNEYKKKWQCSVTDCDKLRTLENFKIAVGFINTDVDKQQKGRGGSIK